MRLRPPLLRSLRSRAFTQIWDLTRNRDMTSSWDANPGYDTRTLTASKPACEEPAAHLRREDHSPNSAFGLDHRVLPSSHHVPAPVPMSDPFQLRCSAFRAADTRERTSVFLARARRVLLSSANIKTLKRADKPPETLREPRNIAVAYLAGIQERRGRQWSMGCEPWPTLARADRWTDNQDADAEWDAKLRRGRRGRKVSQQHSVPPTLCSHLTVSELRSTRPRAHVRHSLSAPGV